jgi:predicted acylesterase/phospholipase RssA
LSDLVLPQVNGLPQLDCTKARIMKKPEFDHTVLLLQGGGALGAYHAGVYQGLAQTGRNPTWVVGVAIGACLACQRSLVDEQQRPQTSLA